MSENKPVQQIRALREEKWERTKSVLLEVEGHIQDAGFHTSHEDDDDGHFSIEYYKGSRRYLVTVSVEESGKEL